MTLTFDGQTLYLLITGFCAGGLLVAVALQLRHIRSRTVADTEREHWRDTEDRLRRELALATEQNATLANEQAALAARLDSERQRFQEQLQLLTAARETLTREFENLANRIFDDKQAVFARTSKQTLDTTVDPLRREIGEFRKKVEDAYTKESAERNQLVGQIGELQKQAQRVGEEAFLLANALKGDSKVQGNWGEVVLERILEESGLHKGREYETQVALADEDGRRRNPDVIIHLPDRRDIIVDAKVSLTDYERYCRADDPVEKQRCLSRHVASLRGHVTGLSRKAYEQLAGVNTLDFVLIFVPIEAAFITALEADATLFRDAYDRGIILVSPSTLLATLRTIHNIWRYEDQNRNAEKIANQAGALYDQFVLVVEALDDLGKHIGRSQEAWTLTRNRLVQGKGNLVKRLEDIRHLGARTRRQLPVDLREQSSEEDERPLLPALDE
ncbi:MAG: DNA recombination protein RmuC [Porticoccaceae bacterium]